ncbi:hypothetical protein ADEAN_000820200 [Angomonas deanei]|uniref:Uncharacterized protein n=1 Tax=Angomonas deanei TaxID=59799 RepID=A0A7G2CLF4_9TRYP|nr:hypothetical protein ADEAN_000820200 [Angomonas deanei]
MLVQNNPSGSPAPHVEKSRLLYGVLGDVGWYVMTHYLALFDWEMPASVRARVVARHPITKSPTVVEGELYFFVDFDQFDWEAHRQQQQAGTRGGKGGKKKGAQTPKKEANKGPRTSIGGGNFVRIIDHNSMDKKTIVAAHFYISNEADTALVQDFSASGSEGQVLVSDLLFPRVEGDEVTRGHGNTHNSNNPLDDDAPETTDEDSDLELSSPSSLSSSSPRVASPEPGSVPTSRSPRDTDLGANSTPNNASSSDAVDTLTVPTTTDNNNNNTSGSEVVVKPPEESLEDIIKKLPKVHSTYSLITVENTVTANGIPQRLRRQRVCAFPPEEYSDIRLGVKLRQLLQGQATAETTATGPVTGSVTPTRFGTSPSKFGRRNSQGNAPGGKKSDNNKNANAVKDQSHPSRFPITNPDEAMTYMSRMWRVQQLIETLYESAEREAYEREKHAKEMQVETSQNWGALEDKENFDNL